MHTEAKNIFLRRFARSILWLAVFSLIFATVESVAQPAVVIENVTLIDGTGSAPVADATVVLDNGVIARIATGAAARTLRKPRGATVVDARGKFLIPGMMDMHIHLLGGGAWRDSSAQSDKPVDPDTGLRTLQGYLYYGFTSVYDAGNNPDFILSLRERERRNEIVAPRIFATGQLLSYPGSWSVGYAGIGVRDWPGTIDDLELQVARKPDIQKITYEAMGVGPNPLVRQLPRELMRQMIDYLHARGVRTTAHISNERMARDAIDAGIDTLAHAPATGVITQDFAELVAAKKIPIQTSLAVFDEIRALKDGVDFLRTPEYRAVVDPREPAVREQARQRYLKLGWPDWFAAIYSYALRNVKRIHDAGGILVLATDRTLAPAALRELELVVESGIPPLAALRIATLNAATFLGRERDLGSIELGKIADVVLLEADPSVDIRNVRKVVRVWKGGVEIDRTRLDLPINTPSIAAYQSPSP
jgi:imidazolonepropionase-like amidohydrolase